MAYSTAVLGTAVVRKLQERADTAIVVIGSDRFTRIDLAQARSLNFIAALNLTAAVRTLKVKNTKDLFINVPPTDLALPGIGVYAYAVLGAIFELQQLGTLDDWMTRNLKKGDAVVTINTVKKRLQNESSKTVARSRNNKKGTA